MTRCQADPPCELGMVCHHDGQVRTTQRFMVEVLATEAEARELARLTQRLLEGTQMDALTYFHAPHKAPCCIQEPEA